jgi:hypothetical protein
MRGVLLGPAGGPVAPPGGRSGSRRSGDRTEAEARRASAKRPPERAALSLPARRSRDPRRDPRIADAARLAIGGTGAPSHLLSAAGAGRPWLSDRSAVRCAPEAPVAEEKTNLSGAAWFTANQGKYPNSKLTKDLDETFKKNVDEFLKALEDAGAKVSIASTRRSADRAYLMHYCWKVAKGELKPADVPARAGVDIEWDHGELAKSKKAAQEMVSKFGMKHVASLTSLHIAGKAIDMNITWKGTLKIKDKSGTEHEVEFMADVDKNTKLHGVGKSYGVIKLVKTTGQPDPPHWSLNGH